MSMDKSLKRSNRLQRARSVLTRAERIAKLKSEDRWREGMSPFGMPKVKVLRAAIKKAKKQAKEQEATEAESEKSTEEKS